MQPIQMARVRLACLVLVLALGVVCGASGARVEFAAVQAPSEWRMGPAAPRHSEVSFTMALRQRNLHRLERWFWEVSDPAHVSYRQFGTIDEINALVAPTPAEVAQVRKWLRAAGAGARSVRHRGDTLHVRTNVAHAEKLFETRFHLFTWQSPSAHGRASRRWTAPLRSVVRPVGALSMPAELAPLVELITGLTTFPAAADSDTPSRHPSIFKQRAWRRDARAAAELLDGDQLDGGVVPATIHELYSAAPTELQMSAVGANSSVGVVSFNAHAFGEADLRQYVTGLGLPLASHNVTHVVGRNNQSRPVFSGESDLDVEMIVGLSGAQVDTWFWEEESGYLYTFARHLFGRADAPAVVSLSFCWWEGEQCLASNGECALMGVNSSVYVSRVNTEFQKIGLRGITLIACSGDDGAPGSTNSDCEVSQLRADFPASSPYVTAVGATEVVNATVLPEPPPPLCAQVPQAPCLLTGSEQAVSNAISFFASGGGFSNMSARPAYQSAAVQAYLSSGVPLPPASYYNAAGRASPDVAAVGHNLLTVINGRPQTTDGTSASAPIFAALVARLNLVSLRTAGRPLGFLNPLLYRMAEEAPASFRDVLQGDNAFTQVSHGTHSPCKGFQAAKGWDPVTGLGTPQLTHMEEYISKIQLPHKQTRIDTE